MNAFLRPLAPLLLALPLAAPAQSWDLAADFTGSNTTGPGANGAWSFGWGSVRDDAFRPDNCGAAAADLPLIGCSSGGHGVPAMDAIVVLNPTGQPASFYGAMLPAHTAGMRTDTDGRASVVRWTAPADGQYRVSAAFEQLSWSPFSEAENVYVARSLDTASLVSGGILTTAELNGVGHSMHFDSVIDAQAGSMWNFIVGRNGAATTADSLSASIHISAVPELPSRVALALGLAALGVAARRCGRSEP